MMHLLYTNLNQNNNNEKSGVTRVVSSRIGEAVTVCRSPRAISHMRPVAA